jgi:hypothetical protein
LNLSILSGISTIINSILQKFIKNSALWILFAKRKMIIVILLAFDVCERNKNE